MKFLLVLAVCIYSASAKIKCVQGTDGTAAATDCSKAEDTHCSQPKFVEYTGMSTGVNYACGKCAGDTKDSTCEECTGEATKGCNTPKEVGEDFKCYSYTYNKTSKAFDMSAKTSACKRLKASAIACNMPKSGADEKTYTLKTGCGNCTKADTSCEQCSKDSCNKSSAIRVAVLFAPLLAVLVNLLWSADLTNMYLSWTLVNRIIIILWTYNFVNFTANLWI